MDSKFLMGMNDALTRTSISKNEQTFLDEELKRNLQKVAIKEACRFYQQFFNEAPVSQTVDELVDRYRKDFQKANSFGLFKSGSRGNTITFPTVVARPSPNNRLEGEITLGSEIFNSPIA